METHRIYIYLMDKIKISHWKRACLWECLNLPYSKDIECCPPLYYTYKQNSVFVGDFKKSEFLELKNELLKIIREEEDKISFWTFKYKDDVKEINFGVTDIEDDYFYHFPQEYPASKMTILSGGVNWGFFYG